MEKAIPLSHKVVAFVFSISFVGSIIFSMIDKLSNQLHFKFFVLILPLLIFGFFSVVAAKEILKHFPKK
jgi:hypothetical protein